MPRLRRCNTCNAPKPLDDYPNGGFVCTPCRSTKPIPGSPVSISLPSIPVGAVPSSRTTTPRSETPASSEIADVDQSEIRHTPVPLSASPRPPIPLPPTGRQRLSLHRASDASTGSDFSRPPSHPSRGIYVPCDPGTRRKSPTLTMNSSPARKPSIPQRHYPRVASGNSPPPVCNGYAPTPSPIIIAEPVTEVIQDTQEPIAPIEEPPTTSNSMEFMCPLVSELSSSTMASDCRAMGVIPDTEVVEPITVEVPSLPNTMDGSLVEPNASAKDFMGSEMTMSMTDITALSSLAEFPICETYDAIHEHQQDVIAALEESMGRKTELAMSISTISDGSEQNFPPDAEAAAQSQEMMDISREVEVHEENQEAIEEPLPLVPLVDESTSFAAERETEIPEPSSPLKPLIQEPDAAQEENEMAPVRMSSLSPPSSPRGDENASCKAEPEPEMPEPKSPLMPVINVEDTVPAKVVVPPVKLVNLSNLSSQCSPRGEEDVPINTEAEPVIPEPHSPLTPVISIQDASFNDESIKEVPEPSSPLKPSTNVQDASQEEIEAPPVKRASLSSQYSPRGDENASFSFPNASFSQQNASFSQQNASFSKPPLPNLRALAKAAQESSQTGGGIVRPKSSSFSSQCSPRSGDLEPSSPALSVTEYILQAAERGQSVTEYTTPAAPGGSKSPKLRLSFAQSPQSSCTDSRLIDSMCDSPLPFPTVSPIARELEAVAQENREAAQAAAAAAGLEIKEQELTPRSSFSRIIRYQFPRFSEAESPDRNDSVMSEQMSEIYCAVTGHTESPRTRVSRERRQRRDSILLMIVLSVLIAVVAILAFRVMGNSPEQVTPPLQRESWLSPWLQQFVDGEKPHQISWWVWLRATPEQKRALIALEMERARLEAERQRVVSWWTWIFGLPDTPMAVPSTAPLTQDVPVQQIPSEEETEPEEQAPVCESPPAVPPTPPKTTPTTDVVPQASAAPKETPNPVSSVEGESPREPEKQATPSVSQMEEVKPAEQATVPTIFNSQPPPVDIKGEAAAAAAPAEEGSEEAKQPMDPSTGATDVPPSSPEGSAVPGPVDGVESEPSTAAAPEVKEEPKRGRKGRKGKAEPDGEKTDKLSKAERRKANRERAEARANAAAAAAAAAATKSDESSSSFGTLIGLSTIALIAAGAKFGLGGSPPPPEDAYSPTEKPAIVPAIGPKPRLSTSRNTRAGVSFMEPAASEFGRRSR